MMSARGYDICIATGGRTLVDVREFRFSPGRITILFGESGIGKSLIARALFGLLDADDFDVTINGAPYSRHLAAPETAASRKGGFFVFQEPSTHLNPLLPLGEQLREGSLAGGRDDTELLRALWNGDERGQAHELLRVYPKPYRPSGGEKQRMFLAMALKKMDLVLEDRPASGAADESLFVFDEPTGSLDNRARNTFLGLLFDRYRRSPRTILLITHDYSMISEIERAHRDLLRAISFRELRREDGRVALRDFDARTYTGWLDRHAGGKRNGRPDGVPVLTLESSLGVFGRTLVITRDAAGADPVPLILRPGSMAYLKAPSGAGKTTVMKMLMGLIRGERLRARLGESCLDERTDIGVWRTKIWGRRMTMVFQHADEALNPRSRVREIFHGLPGQADTGTGGVRQRLAELFDEDPGAAFLEKQVSTLSGGQKQRLNLARGLALHPEVLLLDEPLNGLDFESMTRVIALLELKRAAGLALLIVSHNEEIVETMVHPGDLYYLHSR
jgi:peptide/nickel transport system ATP-binding protein